MKKQLKTPKARQRIISMSKFKRKKHIRGKEFTSPYGRLNMYWPICSLTGKHPCKKEDTVSLAYKHLSTCKGCIKISASKLVGLTYKKYPH